jgi:hypothetical protein
MGLERYDKYFGGGKGAADKAASSMKRLYGRKDGDAVFWATIAKRKRKAKSQIKGRPR